MMSEAVPPGDPRERFSDRVVDYARHRPTYPQEAVRAIFSELALQPGSVVADLGSGTGISTRPFLDSGCRVYAVEPNRAMRLAAEAEHGAHPGFTSVAASAEATLLPDASVDLVVAAQAFHWFHPARCRAECLRILRPGGGAALIWNDRQTGGSPFLDGYEHILRTLGTDYAAVNHRNVVQQQALIDHFFGSPPKRVDLPNHQDLDLPALLGRAFSSSYTPSASDPRRGGMELALRALFASTQQGGVVRMTYVTQVFVGRLV